ncbi:MAG: MTH1187 family thiamine-binding protein, partial [Planctomycetota bacterium]
MVVAEFSMFPIGKGISLSAYVARCLEIVDRSGLNYRCHAMGTLLEGEYDEVMAVVRECFQALATELSGTVGLGNIAGVAIAIATGGPGA